MTVTSYQVQNILRTYAKQLSRGQRLARSRTSGETAPDDQFNISVEARRRRVIEKITSEIVAGIGSRMPGLREELGGIEEQALRQLSQEYGKHLDIRQDEDNGQLMFRVVDPHKAEIVQELDAQESAELQERLFAITQEIIDRNMI
jgi:hypothetical protein